jgi:hypothetical protein
MSKKELTEIIRAVIDKMKDQSASDGRTMMCMFGDTCDGAMRYAIMEDDSVYQPKQR